MDKNLRQALLFLQFYFSPWGAAKGEIWEDCFSYDITPHNARKIVLDIISGTPGLSPDEERLMRIVVGEHDMANPGRG